jgi:hypothetical protein
MKNTAILAASVAMAGLVGAVPLNNKRDIVYSTTTEVVWETFVSTTTVWVHPAVDIAEPTFSPAGSFFQVQSSTISSSTSATSTWSYGAPPIAAAPESFPPAPSSTSISVYAAPSTYVEPTPAPTPTSTYIAPAPAPTTSTPAAAASAPAPPAVASAPAPPAPAPPAVASAAVSNSGTTGTFTGDMTYYDVSVGLGSCGVSGTNSQDLVAINHIDMANGANPNSNPHCGKQINIYYNGNMHTATVFDTCPVCAEGSIDVTNELFLKVAPSGDGRVHGVSWSWA